MNGGIKFVDRRKHNQIGKNEFKYWENLPKWKYECRTYWAQ